MKCSCCSFLSCFSSNVILICLFLDSNLAATVRNIYLWKIFILVVFFWGSVPFISASAFLLFRVFRRWDRTGSSPTANASTTRWNVFVWDHQSSIFDNIEPTFWLLTRRITLFSIQFSTNLLQSQSASHMLASFFKFESVGAHSHIFNHNVLTNISEAKSRITIAFVLFKNIFALFALCRSFRALFIVRITRWIVALKTGRNLELLLLESCTSKKHSGDTFSPTAGRFARFLTLHSIFWFESYSRLFSPRPVSIFQN